MDEVLTTATQPPPGGYALAVATIAAVLIGPVAAVLMTRYVDEVRLRKVRKIEIFRTLMRTRSDRLNYEHVGALNLVDFEFYDNDDVRKLYKEYIEHLYKNPSAGEESTFNDERSERFLAMLSGIGSAVGYNYDKKDLERLSYSPRGWGNDADVQRKNAQLLNSVLTGTRPLSVTLQEEKTKPRHPPPPTG